MAESPDAPLLMRPKKGNSYPIYTNLADGAVPLNIGRYAASIAFTRAVILGGVCLAASCVHLLFSTKTFRADMRTGDPGI